jgi:hypothetical protein
MFNNLDNDNNIEVGHTHSGRAFREVHLAKLFKKNYGDEGFYSGEEVDLTDEDHSEPTGIEEGKVEEPRWEEPETSGTAQTTELSIIIPPFDSVALRNQSNPSHQSVHSIVTSSPPHTHSITLGISMVDEMRLPIFRGDGSKDPDQH